MTTTIHQILVPVDLSPSDDVALAYAAEMADRFHSDIGVLHVLRPASLQPMSARELRFRFDRSEPGRRMKACMERFEARGVLLHGFLSVALDEATGILDVAANQGYDLIAMGANRRGKEQHIGRVARAVIGRAACPVMVVHGVELPTQFVSELPVVRHSAGWHLRHS